MRILSLVDVSHARRDVTEHPFSRALGDQTYQPSERADRRNRTPTPVLPQLPVTSVAPAGG